MRITPSASRNIRSFRLGERFRNSISRTEDDVVVLRCVRGICWDKFLQIFQVFGRSDPLDETIVLFSKNIEARIHAHLPAKLFRKPSRASQDSNGPQRIEQCLFFERVRAGREILHARKHCRFRSANLFVHYLWIGLMDRRLKCILPIHGHHHGTQTIGFRVFWRLCSRGRAISSLEPHVTPYAIRWSPYRERKPLLRGYDWV